MTAPAPKSREEWETVFDDMEKQDRNWLHASGDARTAALAKWNMIRSGIIDSIIALQSEVERLQHIAFLIGNIYYYGGFKAETGNERELEALLIAGGFRYRTEDEVLEARKKFPYPEKARQPKGAERMS